jgi:hypothetical protein
MKKQTLNEELFRIKEMMDLSLPKKEKYYLKDRNSWVGGDTSRRYDSIDDLEYEDDDDVHDIDTLYSKYPDSWKHYTSVSGEPSFHKDMMSKFHGDDNPVRVKRLISKVEKDDHDEES